MEIPVILTLMLIFLVSASAEHGIQGDVNGDGFINHYDTHALRNYLVGNVGGIRAANADMNLDDVVDLKDIILLERGLEDGLSEDPDANDVTVRSIVYGQSEMGRDLVCTILEPRQYRRTILTIFAIHGFEDWYDRDGQELVDAANQLIDHFKGGDDLADSRLMIIAPANPDGLYEGTTKDGFGRCNANGVDLNRDFDAAHTPMTNARNYTPYPFSAAESRALRDLVNEYNPDIVLDCHGWEDCTIGDGELARVFNEEMGLRHKKSFSDNAHGYFSYWAHKQGALSLLVEFTNPSFDRQSFVNAIARLTRGEYEDGTGIYTVDPDFQTFETVYAYTRSEGRVTTYLDIDGESTGYISGSEDLCTIEKFYACGYVRVNYPIATGTKTAYCPLDEFIDPLKRVRIYPVTFSRNQSVYRRQDLSERLDTVYTTDEAYCLAVDGNALQIMYPLDAGGWKLGWVPKTAATTAEQRIFLAQSKSLSATLAAPEVAVNSGEMFRLPVKLTASDVIALRLWLIYDASILSLESVENGTVLEYATFNPDITSDLYCALWADSLVSSPCAIDGTLFTPTFKVKDGAAHQVTSVQVVVQSGDVLSCDLNPVALDAISIPVTVGFEESNVLRLPESAIGIAEAAFARSNFDTVYLTAPSLTTIGSRAFADCAHLKNVYIGSSVTTISQDAFVGCDNIVIHGGKGSDAETYAKNAGWVFVVRDL